ncbi:MAG TPA: AraC family ligand binding domain-containing protein [Ktedonobacterales bacterium]
MGNTTPVITPWPATAPPTEAALRMLYAAEGLAPYRWSNAPSDTYAPHRHAYAKVLYVVAGSITFGLPATGEALPLRAGDRLDLPAGVEHDAHVGPDGVVCLEAHRA